MKGLRKRTKVGSWEAWKLGSLEAERLGSWEEDWKAEVEMQKVERKP